MDRIKKTTIRFNLEDSSDADLWNIIQEKKDKKKNNYIKYLLFLGLQQEKNTSILEELFELKNILLNRTVSENIEKNIEEVSGGANVVKEELTLQKESEKTENIEIDADVMNFLDSL